MSVMEMFSEERFADALEQAGALVGYSSGAKS
jgi:hypothetical protein